VNPGEENTPKGMLSPIPPFIKTKYPGLCVMLRRPVLPLSLATFLEKKSQTYHHHKLWSVSHLLSILRRKTRKGTPLEQRGASLSNF